MRYYDIEIRDPDSGKSLKRFTTFTNNESDPNGLDIELDIPVVDYATPAGASYVRIWGISLDDISQSADFNPNYLNGQAGKEIRISGGMKQGLPLAKPEQSMLLASGTIQQAFGNWLGVEMTLELIFTSSDAVVGNKGKNLTLNWTKGMKLSDAIQTTLSNAFADYTPEVNISDSLVLANDEQGFYGTLIQFAQFIKGISQRIVGGDYKGVRIALADKTFRVFDGTTKKDPLTIDFTDLIGQATWQSFGTVQLTCVMRGDLRVGDFIKLPPGQVTTTQQSYAAARQGISFNGVFQVIGIRHVGRYRAPSGESWATIIDASIS
jgi:hypothetical protein